MCPKKRRTEQFATRTPSRFSRSQNATICNDKFYYSCFLQLFSGYFFLYLVIQTDISSHAFRFRKIHLQIARIFFISSSIVHYCTIFTFYIIPFPSAQPQTPKSPGVAGFFGSLYGSAKKDTSKASTADFRF